MLLQPVADQIKASVTDFRLVAGAANFAAAKDDLKMPPAAYVIPLSDSAQPNLLQGYSVEQHVVERFGVILAVSNVRDVRGDAVNAPLEALRKATIGCLLGYQPAADYDPIEYGGGKLLMLDVSVMWWQLEFLTGYYERKV
jgi:hypothetical protein